MIRGTKNCSGGINLKTEEFSTSNPVIALEGTLVESIVADQPEAPVDLDGPHRLLLQAWRFSQLCPREVGLARLIAGLKGQWITRSSGDEERRRLGRRSCRHKVVCEAPTLSFDAVVLDIALGGIRIETERPPKVGATVQVSSSVLPGDQVSCRVAWSGRSQAGLELQGQPEDLAASWLCTLLSETGFDESVIFRSKEILKGASLPVSLRAPHRLLEANCIDLGPGGAKFECDEEIEKATELRIAMGPYGGLDPLLVLGVVVHVDSDEESATWTHTVCFETQNEAQDELLASYIALLVGPVPEFVAAT